MLKTSGTPHYENVPFEVPSSWEWTTLHNITTIIGDGLHGTPQYDSSGDYYFINGNNLLEHKIRIKEDTKRVSEKEYLKYQKPLNETTILVSINGTIGNIGTYNGEKVVLGKSACYFNISSLLHKVYFCYLLESDYFLKYALNSATGSTIKNVPLKAINDFFVPLPPLAEQERIVCEIKRWSALIDQIEQGKVDLQATIKQAKSKILDLAIHGKLVPQHPNDEPVSELLKRINPAAEITCDNGQYGKLPEGWIDIPISLVCDMYQPQTISTADLIPNGKYPVYGANGIIGKYNLFNHPKSEILLTCRGATCGSINISKPFSWINGNAMVMHIKEEYDNSINKRYFAFFLMSTDKGILITGSAQPQITQVSLKKINIKIPPLAEQQRIVYAIEKAFGKLDAIMKSL